MKAKVFAALIAVSVVAFASIAYFGGQRSERSMREEYANSEVDEDEYDSVVKAVRLMEDARNDRDGTRMLRDAMKDGKLTRREYGDILASLQRIDRDEIERLRKKKPSD